MFYKALELMVSENVLNPVISLTLDRALYVLPAGRQDFGSANLEIRIIEGRITEVLSIRLFGYFSLQIMVRSQHICKSALERYIIHCVMIYSVRYEGINSSSTISAW